MTKTLLKRAHAQGFFKNVFIAWSGSPLFVENLTGCLLEKQIFITKPSAEKCSEEQVYLQLYVQLTRYLFYFTDEMSCQILENCSWRSLVLEKTGLASTLSVQLDNSRINFWRKIVFLKKSRCQLFLTIITWDTSIELKSQYLRRSYEQEDLWTRKTNKHIFEKD